MGNFRSFYDLLYLCYFFFSKNNLRSRIQTKIAFRRQVNRDAWDEATTASSVREVVEEEEENDDDMNEAIFDTATPVRLNSSSDASFLQSCQHGDHLSEAAATLTATLPSSRGANPSMRIAYQPQAKLLRAEASGSSAAKQPRVSAPLVSSTNVSLKEPSAR
ncbi:unnamed protein product, partial [Protopolystoma xenopodis]